MNKQSFMEWQPIQENWNNIRLFIPLKGERFDGHSFVEQAFEAGVAAVLWDRSVPNPPENHAVILVDDTLTALQQLAKAYLQEPLARVSSE